MKVALPKSDGTMSVSFIFIFLGILQLSPGQAAILGAVSVLSQCRIKVVKSFTIVQILFNLANVTTATILKWRAYEALLDVRLPSAPDLAGAGAFYFLANSITVQFLLGNPA
jgi:hypothetical protein